MATVTLRDEAVKGILRDKCKKAEGIVFTIRNFLSDAPENTVTLEYVTQALESLSNLMQRFE